MRKLRGFDDHGMCTDCHHPFHTTGVICQAAVAGRPFCGCGSTDAADLQAALEENGLVPNPSTLAMSEEHDPTLDHEEHHIAPGGCMKEYPTTRYPQPSGFPPVSGGSAPADHYVAKHDSEVAKHDSEKVRMDLLPLDVMYEIAKVFTFGCTPKEQGGAGYKEGSWKDVPNGYQRYKGALLRHLHDCENDPGSRDKESDLLSEAHLAWNACALLWYRLHGRKK